jgi:hypothetical protein
MTLHRALVLVAVTSLSACTGARVVSGTEPVENALVIYWSCESGTLTAKGDRTDAYGNAYINPYSPDSSDFDMNAYVPPGKVVVTVEGAGKKRQRIINHQFNQTCRLPYDGEMIDGDCSKDGLNLNAQSDTFNTAENAPVYRMANYFSFECSNQFTDLIFPSEWPSSCRDQYRVFQLRKTFMSPEQQIICNIR